MTSDKNLKLELDAGTIQAIGTLCEVSGLDLPDVITHEFIETATKRIKDIILSLKNQFNQYKNQSEDLKKQVDQLLKQIEDLKNASTTNIHTEIKQESSCETNEKTDKEAKTTTEITNTTPKEGIKIQNILIIANLGVIMHQLKILFTKFGCRVSLVKSYPEAIAELKEQSYECILLDMSSINENELMVLEALRKATAICNSDTQIVVLILPTKDKRLIKQIKAKGADIVIEKHESWHVNIMKELKLVS